MTIQEVVSTVLTDTLNLVATPEQWTRRAYARDKEDCRIEDPVGTHPVDVKCYCLDGALRRVVHKDRREWLHERAAEFASPDDDPNDRYSLRRAVYMYAHSALCQAFRTMYRNRLHAAPDHEPDMVDFHDDLWAWNDTGARNHADVVTALKLAILRERGEY